MEQKNACKQIALGALTQARDHLKLVLDTLGKNETIANSDEIDDAMLAKCAERLIGERRARAKYLPDLHFSEPVWDLILDLFVAQARGRPISVSSACIAANVPPTTALRYIAMLETEGKLERQASNDDARIFYLTLSAPTREALRNYLSQIIRQQRCDMGFLISLQQHATYR